MARKSNHSWVSEGLTANSIDIHDAYATCEHCGMVVYDPRLNIHKADRKPCVKSPRTL